MFLVSQEPTTTVFTMFFCGQHQRKRWYLRSFHHVAIISFFAKGTKSLHNYTNKQQKTIKKRPKLTFARTLTPNVKTQPEGFWGEGRRVTNELPSHRRIKHGHHGLSILGERFSWCQKSYHNDTWPVAAKRPWRHCFRSIDVGHAAAIQRSKT